MMCDHYVLRPRTHVYAMHQHCAELKCCSQKRWPVKSFDHMLHNFSVSTMSKSFQTTLFGIRKKKERFFAQGCESSPYYRVVESLWAISTVTDRKVFLETAQKERSLK